MATKRDGKTRETALQLEGRMVPLLVVKGKRLTVRGQCRAIDHRLDWSPRGVTWQVTLTLTGTEAPSPYRQLIIPHYSVGVGHAVYDRNVWRYTRPFVCDVMEVLSQGVHEYHFDEWCDEYGYNTDSRKALALYEACANESRDLARFINTDLLNAALEDYR